MKKLFIAFITIYISFFSTGCQRLPVENVKVADSPFKEQSQSPMSVNIKDYSVRNFDIENTEKLLKPQGEAVAAGNIFYIQINDVSSLNAVLADYKIPKIPDLDDKYFEKNTVIAIFPEQHSSSITYEVGRIFRDDTTIKIEVNKLTPANITDDIVNKGILVSLSRDQLSSSSKFDICTNTKVLYDKDSKNTLAMDDLQLGRIKLRMTPKQIESTINAQPMKIMQEQNGILEKRFYEDIEIYFQDGEVSYISTTSDKYATPRGLKVGDSVKKLVMLYGAPSQISDDVYSFDISDEYYLFHVEVKDGKIIRIQVNLAC